MLALLVALLVLAIIAFIGRAVLRGLNAPGWLGQVLIGVVLIIGLLMVAQTFGVATPNLR
jgi:hypothetical protein